MKCKILKFHDYLLLESKINEFLENLDENTHIAKVCMTDSDYYAVIIFYESCKEKD